MLFNSIDFAIFFPIVFLAYWFLFNRNLKIQNIFLLVASYFFYGWWDWRFLSLVIISSLTDYTVGIALSKAEIQYKRKLLLFVSLTINLGLLAFFKYFNFFADSFVNAFAFFGHPISAGRLNIILPVGISFYTFKTLSYSIDVYRRTIEPTKDIVSYLNFVSFFPQILAGPIDRPGHLIPQFAQKRIFDYNKVSTGIRLILFGLFKKMVIADSISVLVNAVYNAPSDYVGFPMVVATLFFAFQIYCDFSGYSDIANGICKLLGFDYVNNFNNPYFTTSLKEFWKRWHISLTTWFREYLFFPTALTLSWKIKGQKVLLIKAETFIFIISSSITWILTGLWHGASFTFIVWGAIHGTILIFEHLTKNKKSKKSRNSHSFIHSLNILFRIIITFVFICFGWIFFRANSLSDAFFIIRNMFSDINYYTNFLALSTKFRGIGLSFGNIITIISFIFFMLFIEKMESKGIIEKLFNRKPILKWAFFYLILIFILFWGTENNAANFIYFQF